MMRSLIFLLIITTLFSCHFKDSKNEKVEEKQSAPAPETTGKMGYDLSKPAQKWVLPNELLEISGNTWIDNNHLLVIEDLHPNLYYLKLDKDVPTIEKTVPFETAGDKKVDIEDVTSYGNAVYALWSHGVIYKITNWNSNPVTKELPTSLDKKNNTEGICAGRYIGKVSSMLCADIMPGVIIVFQHEEIPFFTRAVIMERYKVKGENIFIVLQVYFFCFRYCNRIIR